MITKKQWLTALVLFIIFLIIRHKYFYEPPVTEQSIRDAYDRFTPAEKAAVETHVRYFLT